METVIHGIVLGLYLILMLCVGFYYSRRNKTQQDYLLGGRSLNPMVTAMSAQASDMSGWLLMGLPGTAFVLLVNNGIAEAVWTAIGLAIGTYINWLILARRLRKHTAVFNDSITIPSYLENRFQDKTKILRTVAALFIIIFFLIYTAAQFSAGAKLFQTVFGLDYKIALIVGAVIIVSYTFLGGFLAVCWTDLIQGCLMFVAIILLAFVALAKTGGIEATNAILAAPELAGRPLVLSDWFGFKAYGALGIASALAWGLGYFGQPHIITRFMGIRHSSEIKPARRIAMFWVLISLAFAVFIGVIGKAYLSIHMNPATFASMDGETVFIELVKNIFTGGPLLMIVAGILLTAILSAIMSTADSQLLVTSSAVSEDVYRSLFGKNASPKKLMWISRAAVIVVAIIAAFLAADPNSSVFDLVSYAWGGFGATIGPAVLLSVFWKRMNAAGAIAGVISGGVTVLVWKNFIAPIFPLYELLPAFIISIIFIVVVSLLTKAPDKAIEEQFDKAESIDI
jgi:sodium/proline symporter